MDNQTRRAAGNPYQAVPSDDQELGRNIDVDVDTSDEYISEKSTEVDPPKTPTSNSRSSSEEEDAPLLEDADHSAHENIRQPSPSPPTKKAIVPAEYWVALSNFRRIFTYSTKNDKLLIAAASAASILTGVTLPLMNIVFGELVGVFNALYGPKTDNTETVFLQTINTYVLYIVFLFFARLVLDYVAMLGFRISSIHISASMRSAYLRALVRQPISVLDTLPPGQTSAIITTTANILQIGISEKLSQFIQSTTLILTALTISFYYHLTLSLVASTGLLFIVVFYCVTIPYLVRGLKEVEEADKMGSSVASEVFEMIRMVKSCGAEGKMGRRYGGWVEESRRRGLGLSFLVAIHQAPAFFAIHATFALSFWYAVRLYLSSQETTITTLTIILTSITSIITSLPTISTPLTSALHSASAASILFTIIDAPLPPQLPTISIPSSPITTPNSQEPSHEDTSLANQDIVLSNITFSYPMRWDVKVLDNLSLTIPAGKTTAIVGSSGSGKSTIVGLLQRWYELDGFPPPEAVTLFTHPGTIHLGPHNIRTLPLPWYRSQIGLVQQEPFLFNTTIYQNVEYGLIGTKYEHARRRTKRKMVVRACKEAFADEFIGRLPDGYNTPVGPSGLSLSGGQRQRLSIARAIVSHPPILILDEATSSVDPLSERIIQKALDRISKSRTTIMIAHRLSTVRKADKIVVLQKGRVVQEGSHEVLMGDERGVYWGLVRAQELGMGGFEGESEEGSGDPEKRERSEVRESIVKREDFEFGSDAHLDGHDCSNEKHSVINGFSLFLWEQKYQWKWYTLMLLGALGAGAAFPLHAFLFAKLISLFNLWGQLLKDMTAFWCSMLVLLGLGVGISYFVLGWSANVVSFQITSTYRLQYFTSHLSLPIPYYDTPTHSPGTLTSRIHTDPTQLQQLLGLPLSIVLTALFNILGSIALSLTFGPKLALLSIFTTMPIILLSGYYRLRHEMHFERSNNAVFAESSKFASEAIGAGRTVVSLGMEGKVCAVFEGLLEVHGRGAVGRSMWSTGVYAVSDCSVLICMAFILWYGGQLLASKEYTPFNYLVVYLAVVQGSSSAGQSLSFGPNIAAAFTAANRIRNIRTCQKEDTSISELPSSDISAPTTEKESKGVKIELKNVSFKYPTRDVPVLNNVSMTIEPGQFAAIVGPSGCGKTSIITLLERFYAPTSGSIHFNTHPLPSIPIPHYRSQISLVAQEASLFSGTIRENVLLGLPSIEEEGCKTCKDRAEASQEQRMVSACKEARIHDFVVGLPEGYGTRVGAKGVALSGGQKQRLAIARALIRSPSLFLLDEATSNLDSETEKDVMEVFQQSGRGITRIAVAHRLATIQNADVIFVMGEGGRVVERGTHGELLREKGVYWGMCRGQAFDS